MSRSEIKAPAAWQDLDVSDLHGPILIVGAPDVGKSTLTRYLYTRLREAGKWGGILDGDPGQSVIGLPTTMTVALGEESSAAFPPQGPRWQWFVGATTPAGHMLRVVVGAGRLAERAFTAAAEFVVYDTTGLVDPDQGGLYLKLAKIDLLQPATVIALHEDGVLEPLLQGFRRSEHLQLIELPPSDAARERNRRSRQAYRRRQFQRYFEGSGRLTVHWPAFAVWPEPQFDQERLVAFEDSDGFVRGLGIVESLDLEAYEVIVRTPLASLDAVNLIRIGDIELDPDSFRDRPVNKL